MAIANSIRPARKGNRARKAHPPKKPRRMPATLSDAERLKKSELPITALREIRARLNLINSTAMVVQHALTGQNILLDSDAADVLRWYVSDPLFGQILRINTLLGEEPNEEGEA